MDHAIILELSYTEKIQLEMALMEENILQL